jgi:glycosyltransferase involved in cell wall biosynthesis
MKKIAIMPVKNEAWILEHSLTCASKFFDHIIVADQMSTDATPDICKKFPKVTYIVNNSESYNEGDRRQLLLNAAREYEGYNFIVNLAADEVVTANVLDENVFLSVIEGYQPGVCFNLQWVQLWRTEKVYRDDASVWSNLYRPFAFIDDRKTNFEQGFAHLSLVPEAYVPHMITNHAFKVLHYQFVDFERMLVKQRWARLLEYEKYPQPRVLKSLILNNKYYITKDERGLETSSVPEDWVNGYKPFAPGTHTKLWHIDASLSYIQKYSPRELAWLDIWDYSWPGVSDPRNNIQKWYHTHQHFVSDFNTVIPKKLKNVLKRI